MPLTDWLDRVFPSPRLDATTFWVLDLETSGLRPGHDCVISVGMVPIRDLVIRYGERYHSLVRPPAHERLSTEGIRAHHLLPADLEAAPPFADVLPEVDARLRDGVLVLHHARLDLAFLKDAYRRHHRAWPGPEVVDTVDLLLELRRRLEQWTPNPGPVRAALPEARRSLGLPSYPNHDALSDAVATAELFLVLISRLGAGTLRHIR